MRRAIICVTMFTLVLAVVASSHAVQSIFTATGNATVQPAGPRTGGNGSNFFNIEGSANGMTNSSYGVIDIPLTDATNLFGGTVAGINSVTLNMTRQNAGFSAPGLFSVYYTANPVVSIDNTAPQGSASPLRYILGTGNTNTGIATVGPIPPDTNTLLPLSFLGSFFFPDTGGGSGTGTVDAIPLNFTGAALTDFINIINSGTNVRLVLTPDSVSTAATYAGATNLTATLRQKLVIDAIVAGLPHWDTNGSAAGLGGSGIWDTTTANFNDNTGTGTPIVFNPAKLTVFTGTGGTVTIAAAGITESRGLDFAADGFTVTGGPLTVGSNDPILVTQSAHTATINSKISGGDGLTKGGAGTLVLGNATNDFSGNVTINSGTLQVSSEANLGATTNGLALNGGGIFKLVPSGNLALDAGRSVTGSGGTIDIGAGNTLTINGSANMTGPLTLPNNQTAVLAGGTKTLGGLTLPNGGTLKAGSGGTDTVAINGNISAGGSGISTIQGNVDFGTAARTISIPNAAAKLVVTGGLTSNFAAAAHLIVNGAGTLDVQGDNSALINALQIGSANTAGPTVIARDANSLGNVTVGTVTLFFNSGAVSNQSGNPITFGPTLLSSVGGTGSFPATYAGANMEFQGRLNLFRPTGTAANRITVNNHTTFSGGWTSTGDTGTLANNSGLIINGSGTATLSSASGGNFNAMVIPLTADGATVNFNGVNPNNDGQPVTIGTGMPQTANLLLAATNSGKLNLGMANAFAGSGATPAPARVVLSAGGVLGTGGFSQTLGTLTLSSGAALDLGTGASVVNFADSSAVAWAREQLSVLNWNGTVSTGGGTDRLIFGNSTSGLTLNQVQQIHFQGFNAPFILATGEVVPVSISTRKLGDLNIDGHVDAADIPAFLTALRDLRSYIISNGFTIHDLYNVADVNLSGSIGNADLQGLLDLLKSGGGSTAAVPEPTTLVLLGLALPGLLLAARRRNRRSA